MSRLASHHKTDHAGTPIIPRALAVLAALVGTALLAAPALAHHPMGGLTPATFSQGLLSGIGHPIIGLDHLAFIIAVGLAAATLPKRALMPLAFVAATGAGVVIHLALVNLPLVEVVISLSVLAVGVLLVSGKAIAAAAWAVLFAVAGLFHGYAYGEAIVGAETTPLLAYFLGFAVTQYGIAMAAMTMLRKISVVTPSAQSLRLAGGVVAGVGLAFAHQALSPF